MKRPDLATLFLLAVGVAQPIAATDFVVVAATGALEPDGLQAGQQLGAKTRISLEPWGRALIRETTHCGLTHVVAGMSEYVLTLSEDCSKADEPMEVVGRVQRGEVFAAYLKETGSSQADQLVGALANEPCVFMLRVSEEPDNRRICPSGYALRGMRCSGSYCDNKDLLCCPYLAGEPDPNAKEVQSRQISDEWPNILQSKRFLSGVTCWGPFCDSVLPHQFKSSRLVNSRSCDWTAWASEQPGTWLDCQSGRFAAGMRCRDDYCGDVGLHCCQARVE